jgi:hypothetical protein
MASETFTDRSKSTLAGQLSESSFHDPALGQQHEHLDTERPMNDLQQLPVGLLDPCIELAAVSRIGLAKMAFRRGKLALTLASRASTKSAPCRWSMSAR